VKRQQVPPRGRDDSSWQIPEFLHIDSRTSWISGLYLPMPPVDPQCEARNNVRAWRPQ